MLNLTANKSSRRGGGNVWDGGEQAGAGVGGRAVMGMIRNPPVCFCQSSFRVKLWSAGPVSSVPLETDESIVHPVTALLGPAAAVADR